MGSILASPRVFEGHRRLTNARSLGEKYRDVPRAQPGAALGLGKLEMAGEINLAKRNALIAAAWKQVKDDVVYVPLHHQVIAWAMAKKVDLPIAMNDQPQFRYAKITAAAPAAKKPN